MRLVILLTALLTIFSCVKGSNIYALLGPHILSAPAFSLVMNKLDEIGRELSLDVDGTLLLGIFTGQLPYGVESDYMIMGLHNDPVVFILYKPLSWRLYFKVEFDFEGQSNRAGGMTAFSLFFWGRSQNRAFRFPVDATS